MSPTQQPASSRKTLWLVMPIVLVLAAALAYFWSHPALSPAESATNIPAPLDPSAPDTPQDAPATAPAAPAPAPATRHIYSETADPKADIAAALKQAKSEHKRVLIDFGGDWCPDCQMLDIYFHQSPNAELMANNFVLVHVWIGQMDRNIDVAAKFGVPISKGVPALAVVAPTGKVLFAQDTGQFNKMSRMESSSVTEFLNQWKS